MAMKPEIKSRWVAKLREEGREQTQGQLRDSTGAQCCLDVLCEVAVEDEVINPPVLDEVNKRYGYDTGPPGYSVFEYSVLPDAVSKWANLREIDPGIYTGVDREAASHLNDDLEYTFLEIADFIEADENL